MKVMSTQAARQELERLGEKITTRTMERVLSESPELRPAMRLGSAFAWTPAEVRRLFAARRSKRKK